MLLLGFASCVAFLVAGLPGNIITILALARCKKVILLPQLLFSHQSQTHLLGAGSSTAIAASWLFVAQALRESFHPKKASNRVSAIFLGFSAKFLADKAKSAQFALPVLPWAITNF